MTHIIRICAAPGCGADISHRVKQARHCSTRCGNRATQARYLEAHGNAPRKANSAAWYAANSELAKERASVWCANNPDRVRLSRANRIDKIHAYDRRRNSRSDRREAAMGWRRINRQRVNENENRRKARKLALTVVPFTKVQMKEKLAYWGNKCWMCGSVAQSVDHVKPLSKDGPHMLANLRPACKSCNSRKGASWYGPAALSRFLVTK